MAQEAQRRRLKRLHLVGWDAADWKVIEALLQRREMPVLATLIASGVRGNNATIYPPLMRRRGDEVMAMALVPFKRIGEPEEIAEMVVRLCSDRASYVSGAGYNVDGGYMAL